jgi:hypothetical protein
MALITTIELLNQTFIASESEGLSEDIGAVFSNKTNISGATVSLLTEFGDSADVTAGYMLIQTVADWVNKYTAKYAGICGADSVSGPDPLNSSVMCTGASSGNCFIGANGLLAKQWWSVHNFLQYGGSCIITGEAPSFNILNNPILDKSKFPDIDVVFALDGGVTQANIVYSLVAGRGNDCFGVVGASGFISGYGEPIGGIGGQTANGMQPLGISLGQYGMCVFGEKEHFGLEDEDLTIISTPLIADAAGCLIRTDRDFYPWYSPAGYVRGRILNIIRLKDQPTTAVQNYFNANKINFASTVPGQGTFLFSDKTLVSDDTSPYKNVNVARLLIYLIKTINPIANKLLFEINNSSTRTSFINTITPILSSVEGTGGLQSYRIICDETNNTPVIIDDNKFVVDIVLKPTKTVETIVLRFTNLNL